MLSGGDAWDNSMDGIYSIQRPDALTDITSSRATFHNLKQRMQELVADRGMVENINFNIKTRRYSFDGQCPIDKKPKIEALPSTGNELSSFEKESAPF